MKAIQIAVGGRYMARVNGRVVPVRVLRIREIRSYSAGRPGLRTAWDCVNETTGRTIFVRSAQRFRGPATTTPANVQPAQQPDLPKTPAEFYGRVQDILNGR